MHYAQKFTIFLALILLNSSCSIFVEPMPKGWGNTYGVRPLTGVRGFPSTDSEYGKGFKDGCYSSWDAVTKGLLGDVQAKYDFKRRQKSPDYDSGWWDGYEQCTYIVDWDVV